jgi:hypothetical protein
MATTKITTPELFDLSTVNTALRLPNGDNATRPTSASQGEWRFNTERKYVEFYDGNNWRQIDTEPICTTNTVDYPTTNAAYYKLDSSAADQTTNNKDGAATDVTFYNGQQYSQGAVFNGSSSKIDLADNIIGAGTSSSSASIWFKSSSGNAAGDSETIIDAYNNSSAGWGIFMEPAAGGLPDGHLYLANYTLGGTSGGTSVGYRDGNWHHLVVVFDHTAQTLKAYVDGNSTPVLSQVATVSPTNIFTTKSTIGSQNANPALPRYFNGVLDQCRIFAVALTPDQITQLYNEVQCPCTTDDNFNPTTNAVYYKLDGNANDSTSGAKNGTWSGTEAYAYGPYGISGDFNGTNSVITVSSSLPWSSSFSLSMWLRPASGLIVNYYLPFMQKDYDSGTGGTGVAFYLYGYVLQPWISLGGTPYNIFNTGTLTADTWNHVVLTRTYNVEWELFLNGASLGTYNAQGLTNDFSGTEYYFGANNYSTQYYYDGQIDQVRIFSSALSATQITSLYDEVYCNTVSKLDIFNDNSCTALYEFEDDAKSTDSPTYDGTWAGTEAYGGGQYKKAAIFNGSTSIISIPQPTLSGGFSLSAWFNTTSSGFQSIITMGGTNGVAAAGLNLFTSSGNVITSFGNGSLESYTTTPGTVINTGEWFHVLLTTNNLSTTSTVNLYINGVFAATNASSPHPAIDTTNYTSAFSIGGRNMGGTLQTYFDGSIDQVRVFNRFLDATEVLQVYTE